MSVFCSLAGAPVHDVTIRMPLAGVWTADVVAEGQREFSGRLPLSLGQGLVLSGTAKRSGLRRGAAHVRLYAGAGGMAKRTEAQAYTNVQARIPVQGLLSAAGEVLAASADQGLLMRTLKAWARMGGQPVAMALGSLCAALGASWRHLPDGTVWLGTEAWRPWTGVHEVLDTDVLRNRGLLYLADPTLLPGMTLGGRKVVYVEHTLSASRFRTRVWYGA